MLPFLVSLTYRPRDTSRYGPGVPPTLGPFLYGYSAIARKVLSDIKIVFTSRHKSNAQKLGCSALPDNDKLTAICGCAPTDALRIVMRGEDKR